MRSKIRFCGAMLAAGLLPFAAAGADTLHLKNGNSISGIITNEDENSVELEIDIGTVKFRRNELESVERITQSTEASSLRRQWELKRQRQQEEQQIRIRIENATSHDTPVVKEENIRVDNETGHIITSAVLNGSVPVNLIVDTGASVVVLSRKAGERLAASGTRLRRGKVKQVDLTLGDGRKVKADFVILDSVRIEDSVAENIEAAIMPDESAKPGYDGVLGMSFLSRFNFGFRQKEGKLTLEKLK